MDSSGGLGQSMCSQKQERKHTSNKIFPPVKEKNKMQKGIACNVLWEFNRRDSSVEGGIGMCSTEAGMKFGVYGESRKWGLGVGWLGELGPGKLGDSFIQTCLKHLC